MKSKILITLMALIALGNVSAFTMGKIDKIDPTSLMETNKEAYLSAVYKWDHVG